MKKSFFIFLLDFVIYLTFFFLSFQGDKGDKGERGITATFKGDKFATGIIEGPPGPPGPPGRLTLYICNFWM